VVAVIPVPAVTVVVALNEPGVVIAAGREKVTVEAPLVAVIWLAVPAKVKFPPAGATPLIVSIPAPPPPNASQVAAPAEMSTRTYIVSVASLSQKLPRSWLISCALGAL